MTSAGAYDEAVARFLAYLEDQRRVSAQTLRAYASDLEQFRAALARRYGDPVPGPEAIDALAVRGYVAGMHKEGLAKSSVARKLSAVRSFLKHAVRQGVIDASPAVPGAVIDTCSVRNSPTRR